MNRIINWVIALSMMAVAASLSAVLLPSIDDLARAIEEASPNTFILDDRRWSSASLGHLARHWSRSFAQ